MEDDDNFIIVSCFNAMRKGGKMLSGCRQKDKA
jgi:hypothetical protein